MKQIKRTPKKKSGKSSPTPKITLPEDALSVFDVSGLKIVGRVVKDDGRKLFLEWAGSLTFGAEPKLDAEGKPTGALAIKAAIQPIIPQERIYILRDAAIRGEFYMPEPWMKELYAEFTANCEKGLYGLNPLVKPVTRQVELPANTDSPERETGVELKPRLDAPVQPVASPATDPSGA